MNNLLVYYIQDGEDVLLFPGGAREVCKRKVSVILCLGKTSCVVNSGSGTFGLFTCC